MKPRQFGHSKGVTLVEVMITASILAMITLAVVPIFNLSMRQSSSLEARTALKTEAQDAMRLVGRRLQQCKRIFENSSNDNLYMQRVTLGSAPSALTGSALPTIEESGTISPNDGDFVSASVGNRLFFACLDAPVDMTPQDASASTRAVRIDIYRFYYYYLAAETDGTVGGKTRRNLWEWKSVRFADYVQLNAVTDSTRRTNSAIGLKAAGIDAAWDPSATLPTSAFYTLSAVGVISLTAGYSIAADTSERLIDTLTGIMGSGFRYSVSPNTGTDFSSPETVPLFATASGEFPSGFEAVVVGPTSARQVFMRLVLASQGAFKGIIAHEETISVTARDVW